MCICIYMYICDLALLPARGRGRLRVFHRLDVVFMFTFTQIGRLRVFHVYGPRTSSRMQPRP